eukprot:4244480-Pyramimonas_sp.AAC.1
MERPTGRRTIPGPTLWPTLLANPSSQPWPGEFIPGGRAHYHRPRKPSPRIPAGSGYRYFRASLVESIYTFYICI